MIENDITRRAHYDAAERKFTFEIVQDVEPILERNKAIKGQQKDMDWGRHVATIPNVFLTRWLNEEYERGNISIKLFGPEMDALVDRKLKDPEWAFLRVDK